MNIKITPKIIKSICNKVVISRGKKIINTYLVENITNFSVDDSTISASIDDILNFDVKMDLSDMSCSCSCNYSKVGICKHIAALLYFAMEKGTNFKGSEKQDSSLDELKSAINSADKARLELFIINETAIDEDIRNRALNFFMAKKHKRTVAVYKKEMNSLLKHLIRDYYIPVSKSGELTAFINNIELMAKQGDIEEAIKNYRAVFEVLENKLRTLDDSYGIIQDAIRDALDKYIEYSDKFYTEQKDRRGIIEYLWKQFLKNSDICHYYTEAIKQFCGSEEDWKCYRDIIAKEISSRDDKDSFMFQTIVEEYIDILIQLKNDDELKKAFDEFLSLNGSIAHKKIDYFWSIGKFEDAIKTFEDNINRLHYEDVEQIRTKISDYLYKNNKGRHLNNLIALFKLSPSYDLYEQIEKSSGDFWVNIRDKLYEQIKNSPELIDSFIKKGRMREAFDKLAEIDKTNLYDKYLEILSPLFPEEYFDYYKNSIMRDYKSAQYPDRNLYRTTLRKIINLSIIVGAEDKYAEFLVQLKEENKQRPSFLDEMGKILE